MTFSIETSILDYLSKQDQPRRKSEIADAIPYTIGSIKNATPRLVKAGYIVESKGFYVITSLGRSQLEADPFFTTRPKKNNKTVITIEIPINDLTHLSQQIIASADNDDTKEQLKANQHRLQTMAIFYAVAANVSLPKYQNEKMDEADKALGEKMVNFINELFKS